MKERLNWLGHVIFCLMNIWRNRVRGVSSCIQTVTVVRGDWMNIMGTEFLHRPCETPIGCPSDCVEIITDSCCSFKSVSSYKYVSKILVLLNLLLPWKKKKKKRDFLIQVLLFLRHIFLFLKSSADIFLAKTIIHSVII